MAKKVEIEIDVKGEKEVKGLGQEIRELTKQLRNTPEGTKEWSQIYNKIDDLKDKLAASKVASKDWIDTLEGAGGPLGMLGKGLNNVKVATQSWGAALKATGIGLIVSLIGGLVAAFAETEGSMKKLEPLTIALEKIFGGILEALQPLIDGFVELAMDVMPYVTKAFKVVYSAVTAVFQSLGKLGGAVVKLFKGDFKGAWEDAKSSVTTFADNFEAAEQRFDKGAKKMTKTQKKNLEDQKAAREKALQEKLKQMDAEDKIDEARLNKLKAEALALAKTEQEKLDIEVAFAKKSYDLKKKELEDKQALYKKNSVEYKDYQAQLIALDADYQNTKNANDEKQKQIDLNKKKEYFQKDKLQFQTKLEEENRDQSIADEKELQALDLKLKKGEIKEGEYQQKLHDLRAQQLQNKMNDLNADEQTELNHYKELFDKNLINLEDYEAQKADISKRYGDMRIETLKEQGQNEYNYAVQLAQMLVATKQFEKEAIVQLEEAKINAVATLGGILTQLAGKNKTIAILGLAISQGAAIADILTKFFKTKAELGLSRATYAAMIPNPLTAAIGISGVAATTAASTAATINMAAGLAGVAAAVAQGISAINGGGATGATGGTTGESGAAGNSVQNLGKNYGDGGLLEGPRHAQGGMLINAEGGEAVMTRGAVTMFGPLLSTLNQAGGGTSFTKGAIAQANYDNPKTTQNQSAPVIVKTYVVENELTTSQQRQARLKDLSTL